MNGEARQSAITVVIFWMIVLTIYAVFKNQIHIYAGINSLRYVVTGIVIGLFFSFGFVFLVSKNRLQTTSKTSRNGINCTVGPVPAWNKAPVQTKEKLPKISSDVAKFVNSLSEKHPLHKRLAIALLKVLANDLTIPSTSYKQGHGGLNLFDHTINVSKTMLDRAKTFKYTGLYGKSGVLIVALKNSKYIFEPADPLVLLVALAHDIGKIQGYIYDEGKIVGMKRNHDFLSSTMINCMPEFVALPIEDKKAITGAIAFYHHPQSLPLDVHGRAVDDRTIALMELIRVCDIESSSMEDSFKSNIPIKKIISTDNREITDDEIWIAFNELIEEPGRTNGNGKNNVLVLGQKWEDLVYYKEIFIRNELLKKLNIPDPGTMGDGTHPLTRRLNAILMEKGVLYHIHNGSDYGPSRAFFTVSFYNQKNGALFSTWNAVIIIQPDYQIPFLNQMKTHDARAEIDAPLMGAHSARNKKVNSKKAGEVITSPTNKVEATLTAATQPAETNVTQPNKDESYGGMFGSFVDVVEPVVLQKADEPTTLSTPLVDKEFVSFEELGADEFTEEVRDAKTNENLDALNKIVDVKTEPSVQSIEHIIDISSGDAYVSDGDAAMFASKDMDAENLVAKEKSAIINAEKIKNKQQDREKGIKPAIKRGLDKLDAFQDDLMNGKIIFPRKLTAGNVLMIVRADFATNPAMFTNAMTGTMDIKKHVYIDMGSLEKIYPKTNWNEFIESGIIREKVLSNGDRMLRFESSEGKDIYGHDIPVS